jgi:2-haloacid dehalogenase
VKAELKQVKAMVFDVFGTVVDWRGSVAREISKLARARRMDIDAAAFADAWRARYHPSMDRVRKGDLPWTVLDVLHRASLDELLLEFGVNGLAEADIDHLNRVWHRLKPWPDSVSGLKRLKRRYLLSTLSNGNFALLANMGKFAKLPWDCILSAELFRHYKPDPEVYLGAAALLGVQPHELMMVAAHKNDLAAAKKCGLATAFVHRPLEHGPARKPDLAPAPYLDITARDFNALAAKLNL